MKEEVQGFSEHQKNEYLPIITRVRGQNSFLRFWEIFFSPVGLFQILGKYFFRRPVCSWRKKISLSLYWLQIQRIIWSGTHLSKELAKSPPKFFSKTKVVFNTESVTSLGPGVSRKDVRKNMRFNYSNSRETNRYF